MVRSAATSIENNFSKGLITEATAMNYPENSVADTDNCVFLKTGKVIRRYGIDFEDNFSVTTLQDLGVMSGALAPEDYFSDLAVVEYEWTTVANDGNIAFMVVQIGDRLVFYQVGLQNDISPNLKSFTINLNDFEVTKQYNDEGQFVAGLQASFASGFGYLFVTHPLCTPFYVQYNATSDTITTSSISIQIRDFDRQNDSLANDARPASLTDVHKYNLYNQGWFVTAKNPSSTSNVLTYWDGARADFPSNADIWWVFKNTSEQIDSSLFDTTSLGNTLAPNGHYIYSAFNITRNDTLSVTTLTDKNTSKRPSVVAFYSGRVWYAGVPATGWTSNIYFTKIVEGVNDFGLCYQVGDPTSEDQGDLLGDDGGVIVIPDIAQVLKILPVASNLYVWATNGIWKISGPNGVFTATDYSVTKISSASLSAPNSVVIAEGLPFWWDKAGIYNIQYDPTSNQEQVINISETTIQKLVNSIPDDNLVYVKGVYDNIHKTIHWLYRSTDSDSLFESFSYDKLLVLNLTTQSFSPQTITDNVPRVAGLLFTSGSNNDPLLNNLGASVVKYLTLGNFANDDKTAATISQFKASDYKDWDSYSATGGTFFESYFITGYRVRGDLLRRFQSNYIVVIMSKEDNASALIQGVWDYSNNPQEGFYTTSQQAYKEDARRDYSRHKLKMRGNGYALQFKFRSTDGAPFTIVGWATSDTGNNVP